MIFAGGKRDLHPLRGLINHGPFSAPLGIPTKVQLALLAPKGLLAKLDSIVRELDRPSKPREALNYFPEYLGFQRLFHAPIGTSGNHVRTEMPASLDLLAREKNRTELARQIFDAIAKVATNRNDFDVLLMYLPNEWEACFEFPVLTCMII